MNHDRASDLTEDEVLDALRVDPFDDGLVEALRALRRRGSPGRSRNRRWEVALKNILAATSDDELEDARRDVVLAWARALYSNPSTDPITESICMLDLYGEENDR